MTEDVEKGENRSSVGDGDTIREDHDGTAVSIVRGVVREPAPPAPADRSDSPFATMRPGKPGDDQPVRPAGKGVRWRVGSCDAALPRTDAGPRRRDDPTDWGPNSRSPATSADRAAFAAAVAGCATATNAAARL